MPLLVGRPVHVAGKTPAILVEALEVADTPADRRRGLLGRASLPDGRGLLLPECGAIHTFFMAFPIDILFLDATGKVVRIVDSLRPWRMALCLRAQDTLELPAGTIRRVPIEVGDQLVSAAVRS